MDDCVPALYPWQKSLWGQLHKRLLSDQLQHAILLVAGPGLGQAHFSRVWAGRVLCSAEDDLPCGSCRDCQLYNAGSHPDFHNISLQDKAKTIKIEQVRELINKLVNKPQRAHRRVVVIDPADKMGASAANALLKTLEEPVGHVHFILLAANAKRLLPTITSRCQQMRLQAEPNVVLHWLEQQDVPSQRAQQLLQAAQGAPLQALEMLSNDFFSLRQDVLADLLLLWRREVSVIYLAEKWAQHDAAHLLDILFLVATDLLKLSWNCREDQLNYPDCSATCSEILACLRDNRLLDIVAALTKLRGLMQTNANWQLALENLLIQLVAIGRL